MLTATNTEAYLNAFAQRVLQQAQLELGAYRTEDGKRRRIDSTGKLRNSLPGSYSLKMMPNSMSLKFFEENEAWQTYGYVIDKGRRPGKMPPTDAIKKWIKQKPLRLRDLKKGSFVKMTESKVDSVAFAIAKKIKEKGTNPTYFFTTPFRLEFETLPQELGQAYALDVADFLRFTLDHSIKPIKNT